MRDLLIRSGNRHPFLVHSCSQAHSDFVKTVYRYTHVFGFCVAQALGTDTYVLHCINDSLPVSLRLGGLSRLRICDFDFHMLQFFDVLFFNSESLDYNDEVIDNPGRVKNADKIG